MGLFGIIGDMAVNAIKNKVSQGLLGAKQFLHTDPIEGIKYVTPVIENTFPRVGSALKKFTDHVDKWREYIRNYHFRNIYPVPRENKYKYFKNKRFDIIPENRLYIDGNHRSKPVRKKAELTTQE